MTFVMRDGEHTVFTHEGRLYRIQSKWLETRGNCCDFATGDTYRPDMRTLLDEILNDDRPMMWGFNASSV